ncbi:MAG: hypothetical protein ACJA2S_004106 [Cyclobacteriaceae bacterium]
MQNAITILGWVSRGFFPKLRSDDYFLAFDVIFLARDLQLEIKFFNSLSACNSEELGTFCHFHLLTLDFPLYFFSKKLHPRVTGTSIFVVFNYKDYKSAL